jgi:Lon protease-like protein
VGLLSLFPLDVVLFPGAPLPLHIFEPRYREMIAECIEQKLPFGMVRAGENSLAEVGCSAIIIEVLKKYDDGRFDIRTEGRRRFEIVQVNQERSFLRGEVVFFDDEPGTAPTDDVKVLMELHQRLLAIMGKGAEFESANPVLSFQLAHELPVDLDFKQSMLEMKSEPERIAMLLEYYQATVPKVEKALLVRARAGGNGHVH